MTLQRFTNEKQFSISPARQEIRARRVFRE